VLNRIVLIGRLTKDPELRYTSAGGVAVTTFTVAVDRRFKQQGQQEVDFISVVAWKQLAETCAKYLGKGRQVAVEGRLQIRNYEDREGARRTAAEVVADNVQFLGTPKDRHEAPEQPVFDDSLIREDDIPF